MGGEPGLGSLLCFAPESGTLERGASRLSTDHEPARNRERFSTQNEYLRASSISRAREAPKIFPNELVPYVALGRLKFGWLKALNISNRNSNEWPSARLVRLLKLMSQLW